MNSSEIITLFIDLPDELIVSRIFSLLNEKERQIIRAVSYSWRSTIDNFFGHKVHFNNLNWDKLKKSKNVSHGVFTHWTRDLELNIQISLSPNIQILEIHSPALPLTYYNTLLLLESCRNLHTLILHNLTEGLVEGVKCHDLKSWKVNTSTWFSKLETFKFIDDWSQLKSNFRNYASGCRHRKLEFLSFLFEAMKPTKLKHIEVIVANSYWWLPLALIFDLQIERFHNEQDDSGIMTIPIQSLGKEKLYMLETIVLRNQGQNVTTSLQFYKKNVNTSIQFPRKNPIETFTGQKVARQLESFSKFGIFTETKSPRFNYLQNLTMSYLWLDILEEQYFLKEIKYEIHFEEPVENHTRFLTILERNKSTLQSLTLLSKTRRNADIHLWEGSDFNLMRKLKFLAIIDRSKQLNKTSSRKFILNLIKDIHSLPPSLTRLELHGSIDFENKTIQSCLGSLILLEKLSLISSQSYKPWWMLNGNPLWVLGVNEFLSLSEILLNVKVIEAYWKEQEESYEEMTIVASELKHSELIQMKGIRLKFESYDSVSYECMGMKQTMRLVKAIVLPRLNKFDNLY